MRPKSTIRAVVAAVIVVAVVRAAPTASASAESPARGALAYAATVPGTVITGTEWAPVAGLDAPVTLSSRRCLRLTASTRLASTHAPVAADAAVRDFNAGTVLGGQSHRIVAPGGGGATSYIVQVIVSRDAGTYRFEAVARRAAGGTADTVVTTGQTADRAQFLLVEDIGDDCNWIDPLQP